MIDLMMLKNAPDAPTDAAHRDKQGSPNGKKQKPHAVPPFGKKDEDEKHER